MTEDDFEIELNTNLNEAFKNLGYKYQDACFFKNKGNGIRNLISFDFDGGNSFRVFVGIDYIYDQEVDYDAPPDGALLYRYFTGGSLSDTPKDIYFKNKEHLSKILDRFMRYFSSEIENGFFDVVQNPEDYADNLTEDDCIAKYQIYKKELLFDKARQEAYVILDSYKNMLDIPKIKEFIDTDVKVFLVEENNKAD